MQCTQAIHPKRHGFVSRSGIPRYYESGFYYLQSRYYYPSIGRFINADGLISSELEGGLNLFEYCANDPIQYSDSTGLIRNYNVMMADSGSGGGGGGLLLALGILAVSNPNNAKLVSYVSSVIQDVAEQTKNTLLGNTVYLLRDEQGVVQYVGRTINPEKRAAAHKRNPYRNGLKMEVVASGLTLLQAKAVEQACMAYHHTINTLDKKNNQINGIASWRWLEYIPIAESGLAYSWNQVTNEILYWTGN